MPDASLPHSSRCGALILGWLLVLTSCGPALALEKVSLQLKWLHHFQFAGYYAALEKGFYREAGLDVTIIEGGPATEVEQDVLSGRADFGVGTSALVLNRARGENLVVLGQIFQHSPAVFLTPRKTGIRSIADMAGRRFMFSNQHGDMLALLKKNGIYPNTITMIPHQGDPRDLISGRADVMIAYAFNEPFIMEQSGEPYLTFSPATYGYDFYGDNFFTTGRLIENRPEIARSFREASLKGWRYALANKAEIADLILSRYSREKNRDWLMFEANQIDALVQPTLIELGYQSLSRWKHISAVFAELGMLPRNYDPSGIIYNPEQHTSHRLLFGVIFLSGTIIAVLSILIIAFRRLNQRLNSEIAEREQAEDSLRAKERFLQTIIDSEPECVMILDPNGSLMYMNPAGLAMLELDSLDQARGNTLFHYIPAEHQDPFRRTVEGVFRGEEGYLTFEMTDTKGSCLWLDSHAVPLRNEQGTIISMLAIARDITHRRLAEQALRENEKDLQTILDSMPVGIVLTDGVTIHYLNHHFSERFGYTLDEIPTYQQWFLRAYPDPAYRGSLLDAWGAALTEARARGTAVPPIEAKVRCKDGAVLHTIANTKLIHDRILVIFTDITEREQLHNQLLKLEKLESLGVLAGGIAHDFNNILTGIMGNISFAEMMLEPAHRSCQPLEAAAAASLRAAELARQLLTFARGGEPVKRNVDIDALVRESLSLVLSGSKIKATVNIPDNVQSVEADAGQLNQVINNLVLNAEQAMPDGGVLTIAAANQTLAGSNTCALPPGDYVELTFSDQGCGIPAEALSRIFDPYFSTKSGGTGLGLASVHSIIRKHGGHINVSSTVGQGSTFVMLLPAGGKLVREHTDVPAVTAGENGVGTLLVMDDDEMIRRMASRMLEELGYRVQTCVNGEEAIELYRTALDAGLPFSAAIMDLTIPGGMGGREAAQKILGIDPHARLIVSSGYSNDPVMADYCGHGFCAQIAKPYRAADIATVLRDVLSNGRMIRDEGQRV